MKEGRTRQRFSWVRCCMEVLWSVLEPSLPPLRSFSAHPSTRDNSFGSASAGALYPIAGRRKSKGRLHDHALMCLHGLAAPLSCCRLHMPDLDTPRSSSAPTPTAQTFVHSRYFFSALNRSGAFYEATRTCRVVAPSQLSDSARSDRSEALANNQVNLVRKYPSASSHLQLETKVMALLAAQVDLVWSVLTSRTRQN